MRCGVVGAGAWGTALADLLARGGYEVRLWARERDVVESINATHENARFLAGYILDRSLEAYTDVHDVVGDSSIVLFAPPSFGLRQLARETKRSIAADALVIVATKGIEGDSLALMNEAVEDETGSHRVVALSGPSFALEVIARQPTAVVVAAREAADAVAAQRLFAGDTFRTYTHDDVTGVELGGALKNVMAVATGIADGLRLGNNARAALITRGLAEMTRLGVARGAKARTFAGLAGLGDLVLTCTGALSRNRSLGVEIGEGRTLDEALAGKETVAEGVTTTRSARALAARAGVEMPIVEAVNSVLFEAVPPRDAIAALMARELRGEDD
ncbi:MAG TPA: NAD(P)H-dependent glycerol-3-phosphate dehydrogenase [Gemmatimonadaceae bacterium]|nr:NAD(P)H-dependent glycerol-3-phosphate dehydrogenase [Gemmatimonadaceae bacterium]